MGVYSAEFLAETKKVDRDIFSVLGITWAGPEDGSIAGGANRYYGGFPYVYGSDTLTPYLVHPYVSSWSPVANATSERSGSFNVGETSVTLIDHDRAFTRALYGPYNNRGQNAAIYRFVRGLNPTTVKGTLFKGVIDRWQINNDKTIEIFLRNNDAAFDTFLPNIRSIDSALFPGSPQTSRGIYPPIVFGEWDSTAVTGKGFLPVICTNFSAGTTWEGIVSLGNMKSVDKVYVTSGGTTTLKTFSTHWNYARKQFGGKWYTYVSFTAGNIPAAGDTVTCDAKGIDNLFDGTGTLITNPVEILAAVIRLLAYNDWDGKYGFLSTYVDPVDATSFAASADFMAKLGYEGAFRIGGTTTQTKTSDVLNSWLSSHKYMRLFWNYNGMIACKPLRLAWPGQGSGADQVWIRGDSDIGNQMAIQMDVSEIASQSSGTFLQSATDQKLFGSLDCQDPNITRRVTSSVVLSWSAAKLS